MGTDLNKCPQCGAALPAGSPEGLCPRCVMAMNMATQTDFSEEGPHGTKVMREAPSPAELAGKFPELEIIELLGRGGMGAVYKARQKELDRIVALKILPPGIGETPGFAERFTREAKALAKLNHPNIVTLYEFGRTDGLFFFLMEYVDGVNLRQLLGTGRVSPREALAIVPQICDALQYAHDQGIVHRDIKPDNILMDRRGRVKVADFGLAKIVGNAGAASGLIDADAGKGPQQTGSQGQELTEAGKVMGTPQYMAPEQEQSPLAVDHRADIYALGVVFYQMLTGELPGKPIEPPSKKVQVDVRLDEIVLRALEKKPELRYPQASVFKTEVETVTQTPESRPAASSTPSPAYSPWEPIVTVLGTIILLIIALVATTLSPGVGWALLVVCILGLIICGLTFAGLWPVKSPYFPEPNFSSRNLRRSAPGEAVQSAAARRRRMLLSYGFVASLVGFPIGIALDLPVVWALSLAGVVIAAFKFRGNPVAASGAADPGLPGTAVEAAGRTRGSFMKTVLAVVLVLGAAGLLYTYLDSRRAKRMDSAAGSQAAPDLAPKTKFAAKLADGSFVELVSLMYGSKPRNAVNNIDFWNPDGTKFEGNSGWSFGPSTLSAARDSSLEYRAFVARWGGPSANDTRLMGWRLNEHPQDSADGHFTVTPKGESAENWIGLVQGFPQGKRTATVRFALASGPYQAGPKPNHLWSSSDKTPFGSFSVGKIFDYHGNAAVTLTHNLKGCDYRLRMRVDTDPKPKSKFAGLLWEWRREARGVDRYQPVYGRMVKGGAFNQTFEFPGVSAKAAMARLPRIDFEVRPVRWVEFVNVALNPGDETRLQVRVQAGIFGVRPVVERVLYSVAAQRPVKGLEMDGNGEIEVPEDILKRGEDAFFHWIAEQGIDLLAYGHKKRWNLWTSLKLAPLDQADLEQITGSQIEDALQTRTNQLRLADSSEWHGIRTYDITGLELPQTFAFRTVAGNSGVLQINGFSESPSGVKIRFALVEAPEGRAQQGSDGRLGPVPAEAAQLLEKTRLLYEARNRAPQLPEAEKEFHRNISATTKEMHETLKGTVAEPLIRQQEELVRKYLKAREAGDTNAAKAALEEAKALGKQIVSHIDPNFLKSAETPGKAADAH